MEKSFIKVNVDIYYVLDKYTGGMTVEETIEAWFKDCPFSRYHVSRENCRIGGSERVRESTLRRD